MANRTGSMEPDGPLTETVADTFNPGVEDNAQRVQDAKARAEAEAVENEEEYDSEKMDPEEELWPGGPNFAQINAWKKEHGDVYVTSVTPTHHIVWRTITRFEYRRLVKLLEQKLAQGQSQGEANMDNEESIAEMCILYPPYSRQNGAADLAGVASTISQQVMEASAFVSVDVRQL